jgi:hypothetical protein
MNDWAFLNCPKCKALYHVVKVASGRKILAPRPKIVEAKVRCLCGEPLPSGEGPSELRYFLLPTTAYFLLPTTAVTRKERR